MNFEAVEAAELQADLIYSVTTRNGETVVTLKDGTSRIVQDSDGVIARELRGAIEIVSDVEGMFAMPAPQETHENNIAEATYQPTAYQEQQAKPETQPGALNAAADGDQALMDQLAAELSAVETAAGDEGGAASSSGSGFNSTFASQAVEGLDDVGALQRTQLEYGVEHRADDTKCGCGDLPDLEPKLAIDGVQLVYEDGSVRVMMTATPDSATGILTITIVGIPPTWTVTGEGTYNAATMTWTFTTTQGQIFNGGPTLTPAVDSDVDLNNLTVTVSEYDPNTGQRGSYTTTIDVMVDAVADTPTVNGEDSQGLEDTPVDVKITGAPGDTDGSETIQKFVVSGVPNGFTLSAGTDLGNGSWELSPAQINGLKLNAPHNFHGDVQLSVTIHTTETVTDQDFDLTNNTAQATDTLTVTYIPVADPPVVTVDLPRGDECGCPHADGLVAQVYEDKTIDVKFAATRDAGATADEYLTVTVSGVDLTKLEAGSFTISGQHGATWTRVPGSPDTAASFTITLPKGTDYQGAMHFKPKADSDIDLNDIVVSATAHEPSSDTTADAVPVDFDVIVDAVADKPAVNGEDVSVSDDGVPVAITISGAVTDTDGSESITHYQIKGIPDGFSFNKGANIGGGVWQFTPAQIGGLILTPPAGYEGKLTLEVHVFNYDDPSDKDFDTTNNSNSNSDTFTVEWDDDEPVARKDYLGTAFDCAPGSEQYNAFYKGNLIVGTGYTETLINGQPWNRGDDATHSRKHINTGGADLIGRDGATLVEFTFAGQTVQVPQGGSATLTGYNGAVRITLWSNGDYEVTSDRAGSYNFNYTIADADGDCSTADVCFDTNVSPLVLDLDRDGIELTSAQNGVLFDMTNDGVNEKVGWVSSDDALLALDKNGDGVINNQSELFGNTTDYADGFANLAQYDENGDGVIDANDAIFNSLIVWRDLNQDGISDLGEMFSLSDVDIASITLAAATANYQLNGNTITAEGSFTYTDGSKGALVDAWFAMTLPDDGGKEQGSGEADVFAFDNDPSTSEIVENFNADEGDVLDITALLEGFDPLQAAINDFVFATATDDGSTALAIDTSGSGNADSAVQFALLQGVTTSVDELVAKNAFVTA